MPEARMGMPTSGEVHIWFTRLDNTPDKFQDVLSPDEQDRSERFHHETDRKRYAARHGLLRLLLGRYLNLEAENIHFELKGNGKPRLANYFGTGELFFSTAHSKGLALFAFSQDSVIGIDIEYIRDINHMEPIAERFFSPGERTAFQGLTNGKKRETFFRIWTRKEALLKATGEGISDRLDEIDTSPVIDNSTSKISSGPVSYRGSTWYINDFQIDGCYQAALASRQEPIKIACNNWDNEYA